jgi:hypothetical protein
MSILIVATGIISALIATQVVDKFLLGKNLTFIEIFNNWLMISCIIFAISLPIFYSLFGIYKMFIYLFMNYSGFRYHTISITTLIILDLVFNYNLNKIFNTQNKIKYQDILYVCVRSLFYYVFIYFVIKMF